MSPQRSRLGGFVNEVRGNAEMVKCNPRGHVRVRGLCFTTLSAFFFLFFYCCSSTVVSIFPPPLSPTLNPSLLWLCPWVLYTCSLMTLPFLSPSIPSPLPPGYCQFVLYFNVSGYILLSFFSLSSLSMSGLLLLLMSYIFVRTFTTFIVCKYTALIK